MQLPIQVSQGCACWGGSLGPTAPSGFGGGLEPRCAGVASSPGGLAAITLARGRAAEGRADAGPGEQGLLVLRGHCQPVGRAGVQGAGQTG